MSGETTRMVFESLVYSAGHMQQQYGVDAILVAVFTSRKIAYHSIN